MSIMDSYSARDTEAEVNPRLIQRVMCHSFKAMFNGGTRKRVAAAAAAAGIALPGSTGQPRPPPPRPGSSPTPTPLGLLHSAPSSKAPHSAPEKRLKPDSRERKSSSSMSATPTTLPYIPRFHSIESLAASSANNNSVEKVRPPEIGEEIIMSMTHEMHFTQQIMEQLSPPSLGAPVIEGMWGAQQHAKFGGGCFPWNPFAAAAAYPFLWGQEQRHHFGARTGFRCTEGRMYVAMNNLPMKHAG